MNASFGNSADGIITTLAWAASSTTASSITRRHSGASPIATSHPPNAIGKSSNGTNPNAAATSPAVSLTPAAVNSPDQTKTTASE